MNFYNQNNLPPRTPTPSGSPWREKFTLKQNEETGQWEKVSLGKTNVQEKIEAAAETTRIYNIIERFENGELGSLNQRNGVYADVSEMPKNVFEAQKSAQNAQNNLNKLPNELRQTMIEKGSITDEDIKNYVEKITQKKEVTNE